MYCIQYGLQRSGSDCCGFFDRGLRLGGRRLQQPFNILGEHIDFEVHLCSDRSTTQGGQFPGRRISETSNQSRGPVPSPETVREMPSTLIEPFSTM